MYLVSACLCGVNCKYNGKNNLNADCLRLLENNEALLICPEQLGGLSTPREPSEIQEIVGEKENKKVITRSGDDVTEKFVKGAEEVLRIAKKSNIHAAILKEGSPSCGCNYIYDGNFSGNKIKGEGITCSMLKKAGIDVISDEEFSKKTKEDNKLIFLSDYMKDKEEESNTGNVIYNFVNCNNEMITDLPPKVERTMKELMVLMAQEMLDLKEIEDIAEATGLKYDEVKKIINKEE